MAKATACRIKRKKTGGTICICPNRKGQMRFAKKSRCK